jgi:hypothetical protein
MKAKVRKLAVIADEIRSKIETVGDIIAIGGLLVEAKKQLGHGKFLPWIEREFDFSERTAQNYMKARKFALKYETVADLQLTPSALYVISDDSPTSINTPQGIMAVLKEAAEKRVTRERADEIVMAEWCKAKSAEEAEGAEVSEATERQERERAAAEERAEAEELLARPSEVPPPSPPATATPLEQSFLRVFEESIKGLHTVMTKPVSKFKQSYISAADLQLIADFLRQVAAVKDHHLKQSA